MKRCLHLSVVLPVVPGLALALALSASVTCAAHGPDCACSHTAPALVAPPTWVPLPCVEGPAAAGHGLPPDNRIGRLRLLLTRLIADSVGRTDCLVPPAAGSAKVELPVFTASPLLARWCACPRGP